MDNLANLGIFFAGAGVLLLSFGLFYFVSEYSKINSQSKTEK